MSKSTTVSAAFLAATCALLGGCASEPTCDYSNAPYMQAGSVPPLRAPEGMSAPDRTASLTVPAASASEQPLGKGACLDRPPSYFATNAGNQNTPAPANKEGAAQ